MQRFLKPFLTLKYMKMSGSALPRMRPIPYAAKDAGPPRPAGDVLMKLGVADHEKDYRHYLKGGRTGS